MSIYSQLHLLNVLRSKTKRLPYFVLELLCFPATSILNIISGLLGIQASGQC